MTKEFLSRRKFLQAAGVTVALPWLEATHPAKVEAADLFARRSRMVLVPLDLGLYTPDFFPTKAGRDYPLSKYLQPLDALGLRNDFTVFSGLFHPDCLGGHFAAFSFLSGTPMPRGGGYRPTITMDQLIAEELRGKTRFDSLVLSTAGYTAASTWSYTRNGVRSLAVSSPSKLFAQLFLKGTKKEIDEHVARLRRGKSVLEAVKGRVGDLEKRLGARDRDRLDEYFTSVRDCETRLVMAQEWVEKEKPHVDYAQPKDPDKGDMTGRVRLMFDLIFLALKTDSTRTAVMGIDDLVAVVPLPGVKTNWHPLSHHGGVPDSIKQLNIIDLELFKILGEFLVKLKKATEDGETLLDRTMVLMGSHLGNASNHDNHNLPIIMAGGHFEHGQHIAFDTRPSKNHPLGRLYVSMLREFGLEIPKFACCTSTLSELKSKRA